MTPVVGFEAVALEMVAGSTEDVVITVAAGEDAVDVEFGVTLIEDVVDWFEEIEGVKLVVAVIEDVVIPVAGFVVVVAVEPKG